MDEMSRVLNLQIVGEKQNTLLLRNCEVLCRIDPITNAKSVDIFNAGISIKIAINSSQNQQRLGKMTNKHKTILKNDTFDIVTKPLSQNLLEVFLF